MILCDFLFLLSPSYTLFNWSFCANCFGGNMKKPIIATVVAAAIFSSSASAWDGFDYEQGTHVEIGKGNLVRPGETVEIFDYSRGQYKEVEVQSIYGNGSGATVEVYDHDSDEYRTFDMD
jgi:hypothetical protein